MLRWKGVCGSWVWFSHNISLFLELPGSRSLFSLNFVIICAAICSGQAAVLFRYYFDIFRGWLELSTLTHPEHSKVTLKGTPAKYASLPCNAEAKLIDPIQLANQAIIFNQVNFSDVQPTLAKWGVNPHWSSWNGFLWLCGWASGCCGWAITVGGFLNRCWGGYRGCVGQFWGLYVPFMQTQQGCFYVGLSR